VLNTDSNGYQRIFSNCRRILGIEAWDKVLAALDKDVKPEMFPDTLSSLKTVLHLPAYMDDLARLEWIWHQTKTQNPPPVEPPEKLTVNPTLALVPVGWKNISAMVGDLQDKDVCPTPEASPTHIIIWQHPKTKAFHIREAGDIDLLALKIVIEQIDPQKAAGMGKITVRDIQTALKTAVAQGILLAPLSRIRRDFLPEFRSTNAFEPFEYADIFALQWHVTNACDLHCKHCYDRSNRDPMPYDMALSILDDFYDFCSRMNVRGQVTFTGGNPLLYPDFFKIYKDASEKGFGVAILGNPTPRDQMDKLIGIVKPVFFQISLEGLEEHNDFIRGPGHFQRSLVFLDQLRQMDIYTMVMLTLTHDNIDQVLPLGELLTGRADFFTFNRLATVGEGKSLLMPEKKRFSAFLREYEEAAKQNPILGLKDNLINIVRKEKEIELFGGCTGYGCGAAFNFVSLLPDGEVHACRKFPSLIGNIKKDSLFDIYHSSLARQYRAGSDSCRDCSLNPVCRGCLAVAYSQGLDVFKNSDPFCFLPEQADSTTTY
jgi:selenobiotic family peptide radical SAM maturase